ncbi:MAG TPA: methyl-accepting chemotaxis protein, partial [Rudaea sp.]
MSALRPAWLAHLRIAQKLHVLLAIGLVAIAAIASIAVLAERRGMLEDRIAATRHQVETAHSIAALHYARARRGEIADAAARQTAMDEIKALRYGNNDYFWINDLQPRMLMHPFKPDMVGKDLHGYTDPNGIALFDEMVARVKESGGGSVAYAWPKPGADAPVGKISYVKGFAPWGWIIGSGIYTDDVDAAVHREALVLFAIAAGVALLMGLLSHLVARSIVKPIDQALRLANKIANGELDNRIDAHGHDESSELVRAIGAMQDKLAAQIGQMQSVLAENEVIHEAMDNLGTMVRIADRDGKVLYANSALLRLMKEIEPEIRSFRPEFDADHFIGGNIGDIYPDSAA